MNYVYVYKIVYTLKVVLSFTVKVILTVEIEVIKFIFNRCGHAILTFFRRLAFTPPIIWYGSVTLPCHLQILFTVRAPIKDVDCQSSNRMLLQMYIDI